MNINNVTERVKKCINQILGEERIDFEEIKFKDDTNLSSDLQFSSIEFVKLIISLEIEFKIEFDDTILDFGAFEKFGTLVDFVRLEMEKNEKTAKK